MRLEIEPADALGEADRQLARRLGVRVAGRVVVVKDDDVRAPKLLAVPLRPLRRLARLARAVRVAPRGDAETPKIVGVLLALHA